MIEQSVEEIAQAMQESPKTWAKTFIEMKKTMEEQTNTLQAIYLAHSQAGSTH